MSGEVSVTSWSSAQLANALRPSLSAERLHTNVPLAPFTTFRIGGPADVMYDATSADDLANAVLAARAVGTPCFVLGLGANILVGDRGVRGLVVRNRAVKVDHTEPLVMRAESGAIMADLIRLAVARGLSGLEHYAGIPSTVGGAIWQNLHFLSPAPSRERTMFLAEVVEDVEILTPSGARTRVGAGDMRFGYDTSRLHDSGEVALAASFRLEQGDEAQMQRVLQENLSWRGARHPWLEHHPSVGSIFKKIDGVGAGRLIDQCGLKGVRVGGAQISWMHANIVVNLGGATAADVRKLIAHVQHEVSRQCGQQLEPEISFVGEF